VDIAMEGEDEVTPTMAGTDPLQGFSDMEAISSLPLIKDSATLTARAIEPHRSYNL
jgi:hypothetical protein